jgi:membrane associated rhomboid family serine protease
MTWILLILTLSASVLAFRNPDIGLKWRFSPWMIREKKEYYRFFSYALIHADWMHLGVNLFVLFSFGRAVEHLFAWHFPGKALFYYGILYVGGILFASLPSYGKHKDNPYYAAIGASGAVSAVVFSSIIMRPMAGIMLFPIPFEFPAVVFGVLYLIYSAYMAKRGQDNIGHDAHFWGAVFGIVFTLALKPALLSGMFEQIMQGMP